MGLQGPPYAVLSPLVTDPPDPPGDPESSLFLTCHFAFKAGGKQNEARIRLIGSFYISCVATPVKFTLPSDFDPPKLR